MHQSPLIDLRGLENRWVYDLYDPPICCHCNLPIGADEHTEGCSALVGLDDIHGTYEGSDCSCGADDTPVYLHRGTGTRQRYLAFHIPCFLSRTWAPIQNGGVR